MDHLSYWQREAAPAFQPLPGEIQADAAVVGAGLCGLLCAYFLAQKGVRDVAVLEAREVCGGVTANTTAKVTSQHGLIYAKLLQGLGEQRAAQYLDAQEQALRHCRDVVRREQIDCGLTDCGAWIYARTQKDARAVEDEARAARTLGMAAALEFPAELPFPVTAAMRFPDQAHFHPLRFAFRLCELLDKAGVRIYTQTQVTAAEAGVVHTGRGRVYAKHILICSHYPVIDKASLLFTRLFQERSYVLALQRAGQLRDMYLDCAKGGVSLRPLNDGPDSLILFGAYDHKTGHEDHTSHFSALREEARQAYPRAEPVAQWSAQDCMTHDGIPYIGRYPGAGDGMYLATGFNKWGMTSSMAAAELLSDLIVSGRARYQDVFALDRGDAGLQAKSFVKEAIDIAGNFLTHLTMADTHLKALRPGEGGIVEIGGKRVGAYKDRDGRVYAVKPVCTHMGCALKWNPDEISWDCTCHGSRFDYRGNVLGGPAFQALECRVLEADAYH